MSFLENKLRRSIRRRFCGAFVCVVLVGGASATCHAQGYVNSSGYCVDGDCVPNPANFGFYQTPWRRWPTARPMGLHDRQVESRHIEGLPPVELPDPHREGEVNPAPRRQPREEPLPPPQPNVDPSPALPPLQLPSPEAEEQGSRWQLESEQLVARPVESLSIEQSHFANDRKEATTLRQPARVDQVAVRRSEIAPQQVVQQASWDNPLREGNATFTAQGTENRPVALIIEQKPSPNDERPVDESLANTLSEPGRIQLPANVTPLPPRASHASLQRNPIRSDATSAILPTAFYGDVSENPLRSSGQINPLRTSRNVQLSATSNTFSNPLRGNAQRQGASRE